MERKRWRGDVVEIESKKMGVLEMWRRRSQWGCGVVYLSVWMAKGVSWEMRWKERSGEEMWLKLNERK